MKGQERRNKERREDKGGTSEQVGGNMKIRLKISHHKTLNLVMILTNPKLWLCRTPIRGINQGITLQNLNINKNKLASEYVGLNTLQEPLKPIQIMCSKQPNLYVS